MKRISRRQVILLGGQASLLAILAGCATVTPALVPLPPSSATLPPKTLPPKTVPAATVPEATLMPTTVSTPGIALDAKIGQMIMLGFRGLQVNPGDSIAADVRERNLGAVVLFNFDTIEQSYTRNIASPAQLHALDNSLQALAQ